MTALPPSLAEIAALVGNPARANILLALLGGRALTATELAHAAGVSPQTTSGHLGRLTTAGLLAVRKQGRHSYYQLGSPRIGPMLEGIMAVTADRPPLPLPRWRGEEALRTARTCYDHLAGCLGVALLDALAVGGHVVLDGDGGVVTVSGMAFFTEFGIDLDRLSAGRRTFCRPCLDWSERRPHLAGALGAALAERCFALGWLQRRAGSRALAIPAVGRRGFGDRFGITLPE